MSALGTMADAAIKSVIDRQMTPSVVRVGDDPERTRFDLDQAIIKENAIRSRWKVAFWVSALSGTAIFFATRRRK